MGQYELTSPICNDWIDEPDLQRRRATLSERVNVGQYELTKKIVDWIDEPDLSLGRHGRRRTSIGSTDAEEDGDSVGSKATVKALSRQCY